MDRKTFMQIVGSLIEVGNDSPSIGSTHAPSQSVLAPSQKKKIDHINIKIVPPVIKVVGIGQAGGNILERLAQKAIPGISDYIGIDSNVLKLDAGALQNKQKFSRNSVRKLKWSGRGFLEAFFQGADAVLLVSELEEARTGFVEIIAELAKAKGAFALAFVIIPVESEFAYSNARDAGLESVLYKTDGVMLFPGVNLRCGPDGSLMLPPTEDMARALDNAVIRGVHAFATMLSNTSFTSTEITDIRSVISGTKPCRFGWGAASCGEPGYLASGRAQSNSLYFNGANRGNGALIMLVVNPRGLSKQRRDYIEHLLVSLPGKRSDFIVRLFHDEQMAQDELLMNIFSG